MAESLNIKYFQETSAEFHPTRHLLDVFYPEDAQGLKDIVLFVHGGTWINGSKDIYRSLGRNFAERGIIAVIINYRLGDLVNFKKMALDCATAVKWVYGHAASFGGNKNRIFICGHSAGGHLASLITLNQEYFDLLNMSNPIKGVILIDAFGLNVGKFIEDHGTIYLHHIEKIFTADPKLWKEASPINFVGNAKTAFLIFIGGKTYPFLTEDNRTFITQLKRYGQEVVFKEVEGKSHVHMISQLDHKNNLLYDIIIEWMKGRMYSG